MSTEKPLSPGGPHSFFTAAEDNWFYPTCHSRGPWHEEHCHAGPPTGLLARALEMQLPEKRLTRITVDLSRPIPFAGFYIESQTLREGRIAGNTQAVLKDADGKICATAAGLHMSTLPDQRFKSQEIKLDDHQLATPGPFPLNKALHNKRAFNGDGIQIKYPAGQNAEPGPTTLWMRCVPLLENETPSPFQRICPLADCGNALGRNAEPWEVNFINPDLTVLLHRDPVGEWLASYSTGHWQANGMGMADALLFDNQGCVGRAIQTLLLRPVS